MKNTLNTIKETAKKQTKNIALASALIATLGSCGNKAENTQTTSTDSIKTEQVEKVDSINNKQTINNTTLDNTTPEHNTEDLELDLSTESIEAGLKELEEADKIPERQRLGFESEKGYKTALKIIADQEKIFQDFINNNFAWWEKMDALIKEGIEEYKEIKWYLQQPYSENAKKIMKYLASKK